ncbi:amino acid permease-domain-containing protein [Lasiosphaeris hirsuta]|uniref:Amino acid permease-domain-containing protein n=1 Tax=Lasiosphaeris hirsuta TaxID=260670 RepID=A0AA40AGJ2_9PEZI|nr:amino acid permease-domain-containing protein [Lasiosphaeris hirsuta]
MADQAPAMEISEYRNPFPAYPTHPQYGVPVGHNNTGGYGPPANLNGDQSSDTSPKPASAGGDGPTRPDGPDTELWPDLRERHVNMIGFSMTLGVGLFLSSGKVIFIAGPGLAVIAYLLTGSLMWSTMASMGEMTALFPVKGPTFEFVRRFIDESAGLACAWMLWLSCVIVAAAEILAVTEMFKFQVDPDYLQKVGYPEETVEWKAGLDADPALWVGIFLLVELIINLIPVRIYGRIEYVFGCAKICFIVALILINTILNARQEGHESRFWTYQYPYGFSTREFIVKAPVDADPVVWTGSLGTVAALWTAMVTSFWSLMGWDVILLTAPENHDLAREETVKLSSRKIALRVMLLYALAVFTVGLNVPYDDEGLRNLTINGITGGQTSAFVLAAIRGHVRFLPHFLNGFFIFSATTTGINSLYASSRLLHAIASLRDAWPRWGWVQSIRSRLEYTRLGVPMNAVFASWSVAFLAFLSTKPQSAEILGRLTTVASTATLIVYALNCYTFLLFFNELEHVVAGERDTELHITGSPELRNQYRRSHNRRYPYHSHGQWLRALYGLVFSVLMIFFQGWRSVVPPFSASDFVASYISIAIFIVLTAAYFFKTRGFDPAGWHIRAERFDGLGSIGPVVVSDPHDPRRPACSICGMAHRRGQIVWPEGRGHYGQKSLAVVEWVWTWMK